jgi:hypothetical protein
MFFPNERFCLDCEKIAETMKCPCDKRKVKSKARMPRIGSPEFPNFT